MLQTTSLKPRLTQACAELTRQISVVNEFGETSQVHIPAERALTVYLDKKELVTLMTLGASPEHLVLGFLLNQRLIQSVSEIESVTVDWSLGEGEMGQPGVAAIKTRDGLSQAGPKTAARVVTTGCGQGSVFGDLVSDIDAIQLPADAYITQATLYALVNAIRIQETTYKSSGSVHGCALFKGPDMLMFVEDVGRHNAVDTIAGWMVMNDVSGHDKVFLHHGQAHQRDGHQVSADGCAYCRIAQWHYPNGFGSGRASAALRHWPCDQQALLVFQRNAQIEVASRAGRRCDNQGRDSRCHLKFLNCP
jgi:FdhD protein